MMNRFLAMKAEQKNKPKEHRPISSSECHDLVDANMRRQQIMRETGRKITEIQNDGLGEHRLRDLNDEINKLMRERVDWERRIVELGGQNYTVKITDLEGYRYFGAARRLPGVIEFEKPTDLEKVEGHPEFVEWMRGEEIKRKVKLADMSGHVEDGETGCSSLHSVWYFMLIGLSLYVLVYGL